jgi:hypothetical protein
MSDAAAAGLQAARASDEIEASVENVLPSLRKGIATERYTLSFMSSIGDELAAYRPDFCFRGDRRFLPAQGPLVIIREWRPKAADSAFSPFQILNESQNALCQSQIKAHTMASATSRTRRSGRA